MNFPEWDWQAEKESVFGAVLGGLHQILPVSAGISEMVRAVQLFAARSGPMLSGIRICCPSGKPVWTGHSWEETPYRGCSGAF